MAADVATLVIRVQSDQVSTADRRLKGLTSSGGAASRATDGLMGSFKRLILPLASAAALMKTIGQAIDAQRRFDKLESTLTTVTGSLESANEVFKVLQQYAEQTPFAIDNLNTAFIKLVNYGLDPSERALTSYGNTAASLGKDITEMVDAVANATTGNFQSLGSFGIRTKNMGDSIAFTFRGVTTTVKNNAKEIEGYLMSLGENDFAGAMANSLGKLDDTILALDEQWNNLLLNIMRGGAGDLIKDTIQVGVDALTELNTMFASGEIEGYLDAIGISFRDWGTDITTTVNFLTKLFTDTFGQWGDEGEAVVKFLIDAFKYFPQNVRAMLQILVVEFISGFNAIKAYATAFVDGVKAIFSDDTFANVGARLDNTLDGIAKSREASIGAILDERNATVAAVEDQITATRKLREEYDKAQEAQRNSGEDRLAKYRIEGETPTAGVDKAAEAARKKREQEFKAVIESLQTEEEAIQASYERRAKIIQENTDPNSAQRKQLMARLEKERGEELAKLGESRNSEVEQLRQSLLTQEEAIKESYARRMALIEANTAAGSEIQTRMQEAITKARDKELADVARYRQSSIDSLYSGLLTEQEALQQTYDRRRELILSNEEITELQRQDLLRRLKKQFDDETEAAEMKRLQTQLSVGEQLFDGLAGLAKSYAGEQSTAYRALFAVSKAFSVAQSAMSIATGLAKAQELGFPANLAEMGRVAAAGASILAQINGAQFSGAYDQGGQIPAGKIGIVGEYGPEIVRGPATVRGRELTSRAYPEGGASSQPMAPVLNLKQVNAFDTGVIGDYLSTAAGEELLMNVVHRNRTTIRNMALGG